MKRFAVLAFSLFMVAAAQAQGNSHPASGTVTQLDRAKSRVTISHGAVPSLKWPAMTMGFAVKDKALLEALQPGRKIEFQFVQQGSDYVITAVK
jgi:Cu(I)/Ag(I) efflux system periplasmic protein CusF